MDEQYVATSRRQELFTDLWQDVRIALRSLSRAPGFVVVVALTLSLGIGLNSAVYSIVDAYLFRPMPVANGRDLVILAQTDAALAQPHELSYPNYKDYRSDTTIFRDLLAYTINSANLSSGRGAEPIWMEEATANYFTVLGVKPFPGRFYRPDEDNGELAHPVIVLSYAPLALGGPADARDRASASHWARSDLRCSAWSSVKGSRSRSPACCSGLC
jgi:macrolide transport system ATP-binding/permease protein